MGTGCAFPGELQILDGVLDGGGCVPSSQRDVADTDGAPGCSSNLKPGTHSTQKFFQKLPKLLTDPPGLSDNVDTSTFTSDMLDIYARVFQSGNYNFRAARIPLPSGLNTANWEVFLEDYHDREIVDFLKYGWPSGFSHSSTLLSTLRNHSSGLSSDSHI